MQFGHTRAASLGVLLPMKADEGVPPSDKRQDLGCQTWAQAVARCAQLRMMVPDCQIVGQSIVRLAGSSPTVQNHLFTRGVANSQEGWLQVGHSHHASWRFPLPLAIMAAPTDVQCTSHSALKRVTFCPNPQLLRGAAICPLSPP